MDANPEEEADLREVSADPVDPLQSDPLERWMERYQAADPQAPSVLVHSISPALIRFFCVQGGSREEAEDLLQETWLRIHRSRHTYRRGEQLLPWVYAIARHVRVDAYRKKRRVTIHESAVEVLPEPPSVQSNSAANLPSFEELVASLPSGQKEVVTMLKVAGLSLEQVAQATSSTVGSVKQKAHRAYERLRLLLGTGGEGTS